MGGSLAQSVLKDTKLIVSDGFSFFNAEMVPPACNDFSSPYDRMGPNSFFGRGRVLDVQMFCSPCLLALQATLSPQELDFVECFAGKGEVSAAFRRVACQVFLYCSMLIFQQNAFKQETLKG